MIRARQFRPSVMVLVGWLAAGQALAPSSVRAAHSDHAAQAREYYEEATALYDAGKYGEAVDVYKKAYKLKSDPNFLFNIAQGYRLGGYTKEAIRYYRDYLRKAHHPPNSEDVKAKIAALEGQGGSAPEGAGAPAAEKATMASAEKPAKGELAKDAGVAPSEPSAATTSRLLAYSEPKRNARPDRAMIEAREIYSRANELFAAGKFSESVDAYKDAYSHKEDPVVLYNIAEAYVRSGYPNEALRFYRTYLRKARHPSNREEVTAKIAELDDKASTEVATSVAAPTPTSPPPPVRVEAPAPPAVAKAAPAPAVDSPPSARPQAVDTEAPVARPRKNVALIAAGAVVAAVGLGALGGGIAMGLMAKSASDQQTSSATFDPDLDSKGKLYNTLTEVLLPVGGVLVAGGVVIAVMGALKKPPAEKDAAHSRLDFQIVPSLGPSHAGATFHLAF